VILLGYFILGMLMVQAFFPLIDGIAAMLLTALEALKGYFGIKVAEYNSQIRKIAIEDEDDKPKCRIGFTTEEEEDE
jgi:hypothetical protein